MYFVFRSQHLLQSHQVLLFVLSLLLLLLLRLLLLLVMMMMSQDSQPLDIDQTDPHQRVIILFSLVAGDDSVGRLRGDGIFNKRH